MRPIYTVVTASSVILIHPYCKKLHILLLISLTSFWL